MTADILLFSTSCLLAFCLKLNALDDYIPEFGSGPPLLNSAAIHSDRLLCLGLDLTEALSFPRTCLSALKYLCSHSRMV